MRQNGDAPMSHSPHPWCFEHPGPCWARQQSGGFEWELRSAALQRGAVGGFNAGGASAMARFAPDSFYLAARARAGHNLGADFGASAPEASLQTTGAAHPSATSGEAAAAFNLNG